MVAGLAAGLLAAGPGLRAAEPGVNINPVVLEGLSSTKDHGVVKVMADPTLAEGRLVLEGRLRLTVPPPLQTSRPRM